MSLILPLEILSTMEVSFRVSLPSGTFGLNMASRAGDCSSSSVAGTGAPGMFLHLQTVSELDGVTLLLSASRIGPNTPTENVRERTASASNQEIRVSSSPSSSCTVLAPDSLLFSVDEDLFVPFPFNNSPSPDLLGPVDTHPEHTNNAQMLRLPTGPLSASSTAAAASDLALFEFEHGLATPRSTVSNVSASPNLAFATSPPPSTGPGAGYSFPSPAPSSSSGARAQSPMPNHRRFRCPDGDCEREFSSKYTWTRHVEGHAQDRSHVREREKKYFPCEMGCPMRFSRKHDRLRHEVTQHGRVCDWSCAACSGFFSSEATLRKHKCRSRG
ncbi:Transcriptional regulator prz1 [Mycena kentingensis (nom. inval.)]|nr:Transcriptional regulator prz1 [Mycena kentingensis (nom. inval.)]